MIVGAVVLADRKLYSQLIGVQAVAQIPEVDRLYINIETDDISKYDPLISYLGTQDKPYDVDVWSFSQTNRQRPGFDQDVRRVSFIAIARNMALDYAWQYHASHILFVDSDVAPDPQGFRYLLNMNKPLVGGFVPGRGAHSHVHYIFGIREDRGTHALCAHGTAGYMLVRRDVFSIVRFRIGPHPKNPDLLLTEDPAFAADAEAMLGIEGWWIDRRATATHFDDPDRPLTLAEAHEGYQCMAHP